MAEILGTFSQGILTTSYQTIYTVPIGETFVPKTITFCNFGPTTSKITLNLVANGDVVGNKNYIIKDKLILPNESVFANLDMYLQSGFTIQVVTEINNTVNYQVSGVRMNNE